MILLELKNIRKEYKIKKGLLGPAKAVIKAVDNVSLVINKGESLGLVGESGSGKTTLAKIILKLEEPDQGKIIFEGKDVTKAKGKFLKEYRKQCQMIFQDPYSSLDPRWNIRRIMNEAFHPDPAKYPTEKSKEKRSAELLKSVGLDSSILSRYPHEFSGGERQRIAIARALVLEPKLLVLDEAVSSLDMIVQGQILNLLEDLKKKYDLTLIFITHNLRVVKKVSRVIAVMCQGKIVEQASTQELLQNPLHLYTKQLLTAALTYQADPQSPEVQISSSSQLVEASKGHFVLK